MLAVLHDNAPRYSLGEETWSIVTEKANAKRSKGKGSASLRSLCPNFHTTIIAYYFVVFVVSLSDLNRILFKAFRLSL